MEKTKRSFGRMLLLLFLLVGLVASFATPGVADVSAASAFGGVQGRFVSRRYAKDLQVGDYVNNLMPYRKNQSFRVIAKDAQGVMVRSEFAVPVDNSSDPAADMSAFSNTGVTNEVKDNYGKPFINQWMAHRTNATPDDGRPENGTNYWEQSNIRKTLNDAYGVWVGSNPDANRDASVIKNPKVKQPLTWSELAWRVDGSTDDSGNSDKVILSRNASSTYIDYAVFGRNADGSWIGSNTSSAGFTSAEEFSGKKTVYPGKDADGNTVNWVYADVRSNSNIDWAGNVNLIYDNNPYYEADDTVFLAPINVLLSQDVQALRNFNGGPYMQTLGWDKNPVSAWTSLPASYIGINRYHYAGTSVVTLDAAGRLAWSRAKDTAAMVPCLYLKNDAILTWASKATQINGENKQYDRYEIKNSTVQTPTAPSFGTIPNWSTTVGTVVGEKQGELDWLIPVNTQDVNVTLKSGALPDGIKINNGTAVGYVTRLDGTPTKAGTYKFTLQAENSFGTATSSEFSITISKGLPVTPPSIPALTAKVGQTVGDIKGQITDAKWRILAADNTSFDAVGTVDISAVYNPDSNQYEDYVTPITVKVSAGQQTAPSNPPTSLSGKVGKSTADVSVPQYYKILDGVVFDKVGDVEVTLAYNTDPSNLSDWTTKINVTVGKGDPKQPSDDQKSIIADLKLQAVWGQKIGDLSSKLPKEWAFAEPDKTFDVLSDSTTDADGVTSLTPRNISGVFNDDPTNYNDNTAVAIPVKVDKAQQEAPSETIDVLSAKIGQKLSELNGQLPNNKFSFEDPNFVLGQGGEITVSVLYNTDKAHLYDYRLEATISVDKRDPQKPNDVPQDLSAAVGQTTEDIRLPIGWSFAENIAFDEVGTHPVDAIYNPDQAVYKDYETQLQIRVAAGQQSAPEQEPSFVATWNDLTDSLDFGAEYRLVGVADGTMLDDDFLIRWYAENGLSNNEVRYPAEITLQMAYNTDPVNLSDYIFGAKLTINKRLSEPEANLPRLEGDLNSLLSSVALPQGYVWVNPDLKMDEAFRGGQNGDRIGVAKAMYTQDNNDLHYDPIEVELKIHVTSLSDKVNDKLNNPWIFIGSALGVALVIFLVFFFIIKKGGKGKKTMTATARQGDVRPAMARPVGYGKQPPQAGGYGTTQVVNPQLTQGRGVYPQTQMAPQTQVVQPGQRPGQPGQTQFRPAPGQPGQRPGMPGQMRPGQPGQRPGMPPQGGPRPPQGR
ncbi:MAG: putative Ig domain-containing protein [Firmicutes bacterium]|nr:putative Ig domain-containing protein [Bacillota bacterium]